MTNPSLISYLQPAEAPYRLTLLPCEDATYPFQVICDVGPFASLIAGRFETDAGSVLQRTFLLIQKDRYNIPSQMANTLTNADVDRLWQRAATQRSHEPTVIAPVHLSAQQSADGLLRPFAPLWYCVDHAHFFTATCPHCRTPLTLCTDDDLLASTRLAPYATSISRYLYCRECSEPGLPETFYVHSLSESDPRRLTDWQTLSRIYAESAATSQSAPCPGCNSAPESSSYRFTPVAFYPFFLLTYPADLVCGADLLPLIGGAPAGMVKEALKKKRQTGRLAVLDAQFPDRRTEEPLLLFNAEPRLFLEILMIKLTFLSQLFQKAGTCIREQMEMGAGPEEIWVHVPAKATWTPPFWDLHISVMDLGCIRFPQPEKPHFPEGYGFYHFGCLWFAILTANSRVEIRDVYETVRNMARYGDPELTRFPPESLFWVPPKEKVPEQWHPIWQRTLKLGWQLIEAGLAGGKKFSHKAFMDQLQAAIAETRQLLFHPPPEKAPAVRTRAADDRPAVPETPETERQRRIQGILEEILARWRLDAKEASIDGLLPTEAMRAPVPAEPDVEPTRVLPRPEQSETAGNHAEKPAPAEKEEWDEMTETRILRPVQSPPPGQVSPKEAPETASADADADAEPEWDALPETVIIRKPTAPDKPGGRGASPEQAATAQGSETAPSDPSGDGEADAFDPEKTVILPQDGENGPPRQPDRAASKERKPPRKAPPAPQTEGENGANGPDTPEDGEWSDLPETVILAPDASPRRRPPASPGAAPAPAPHPPGSGRPAQGQPPAEGRPGPDQSGSHRPPPPRPPEAESDGEDEDDLMLKTVLIRSDDTEEKEDGRGS